jgi:hypothetical protein
MAGRRQVPERAFPSQPGQRGRDRSALLIPADDPGIDIRGPRHRRGVTQVAGHLLADPGDRPSPRGRGDGALGHGQADRGQDGGVPGAEVLGGELAAGHFAQVVVDVGGGDIVPAPAAPVGEQPVAAAAASLEAADDRAHPVLGHRLFLELAGLAGIGEDDLPAGDSYVVAADSRQAKAPILGRVLLPAGPEETKVDELDSCCQHPLPHQPAFPQMPADHLAQPGKGGAELQHPVVLLLITLHAPQVVVEVLAAPRRVRPGRLDVSRRIGADPHVLPGRRDHQGPDPGDRARIAHGSSTRPQIPEATPAAPAPDPRRTGITAHKLTPAGGWRTLRMGSRAGPDTGSRRGLLMRYAPAAPQPPELLFTKTTPHAMHLPGLKGEGQAFRAHTATSADGLRPPFLPTAGPTGGDRKEQFGICRNAGTAGAPVSIVGRSHVEPRTMCGGIGPGSRCPG